MSNLVFLSASQLSKAIREREVSSLEVLEAHLEHIARHNPTLNAIVTLDKERALALAKKADEALVRGEIWGALHGVPFTVKDNFETAGLLTTCSYQPLINYIPQKDASVVTRMRSAGAIILGKTNIPRLGADIQTKSPLFGRANNPWDLTCTPGGSTGGGAAAIAAGLSPLEIANDSAGSIRIPAHFCGVFGLKPTEHRVSMAGQIPPLPGRSRSLRHLQVAGALARSVEDLRLCLSLIEGPDSRQWDVPPVTEASLKLRPLQEYRFAWTNDFDGVPITHSTRAALEQLVNKLTQLGCKVERLNPPGFDFTQAWETFGEIAATELYAKEPPLALFLCRIMSLFPSSIIPGGPITRGSVRGARLSMGINNTAMMKRDNLITVMDSFFDNWDAWLCPVYPTSAFTHRFTGKLMDVDGQKLSYLMAACAYTSVLNLTGNPVVVLPMGQTKEGLPIGVQLVGRRWRDMELLNIAEKLTEVTGSFQRPPGY